MKIGILGAGHLGKQHMELLKSMVEFELVGFYDKLPKKRETLAKELAVTAFDSIEELLKKVDIIDVTTPLDSHFEIVSKAIRMSKHVFVNPPITSTIEEAKALMALSEEANVKVQIGHTGRFNAAFTALKPYLHHPIFVDMKRVAPFDKHTKDISVVLDLMLQDLDIILSIVDATVRKISVKGVEIISQTTDMANVRLEFDDHSVANLTTSRVAYKEVQKSQFFQKGSYLTVDFLENKVTVAELKKAKGNEPNWCFSYPKVKDTDETKEALVNFLEAIKNDVTPLVSIYDAYNTLKLAHQIIEQLEKANSHLNTN